MLAAMPGPDLPAPDQPFDVDAWRHRWPTGVERAELIDGIPVFSGDFDERDVEIARGAYPGRQVILNESGGLEVHPAGDGPPRSVFDRFTAAGPSGPA